MSPERPWRFPCHGPEEIQYRPIEDTHHRQPLGLESDVSKHTTELLRLPQVLEIIPVSRATWYAGVKAGLYPLQVKIGQRAVAWRRSDIEALAASFSN